MRLDPATRLRLTVVATGTILSGALLAAGGAAVPEGAAAGAWPTGAVICFGAFFLLNPAHLLLLLVPSLGFPGSPWPGLPVALALDVGWWWVVAGLAGRLAADRPAAP